MGDKIFHQDDARRRILEGAKILYDAVKTTMGPKGHNVVIGKGYPPRVTHDGVTVARNINIRVIDDETLGQKVGADLIKEAAEKMNTVAGDGTTTVTVLTYHILNEANKLIAAGHSPMTLRRELEAAAEEAISLVKGEDVTGKLAEVGFISAASREIGDMVADVIEAIGQDGSVTIQASQDIETKYEIVNGFSIPRGMQSPYFANSKGEAELELPGVLVISGKIYDWNDLMPVIEALIKEKHPLLIVAEECGTDVISNLVLNKMKGIFPSVAVSVGNQKEYLRDLAAYTGATIFGIDSGNSLQNFTPSDLGRAKSVVVNNEKTTVIVGLGDTVDYEKQLEATLKTAKQTYEKDHIKARLASIRGKVAIINVGGATETEVEEKIYRIEDAVAAVKASLEEGIVPGGGVALLNVANGLHGDDYGVRLLKNALEQPFRILLENAGVVPEAFYTSLEDGQGVDVNTLKVVNMVRAGIIDPAVVTKRAIQNAVSVAGTAMTVGALIVEVPDEKIAE
jgi:chaperonin GroEL